MKKSQLFSKIMSDSARASTPAQAAGSPLVWAEIQVEVGRRGWRWEVCGTVPQSGPARRVREPEPIMYAAIKNPCSFQRSGRKDACVAGIQSVGGMQIGLRPTGFDL